MAVLDSFVNFSFRLPSVLVPCAFLLLLLPQRGDTLRYLTEPRAEFVAHNVIEEFLRLFIAELATQMEPGDVDDPFADNRRQSRREVSSCGSYVLRHEPPYHTVCYRPQSRCLPRQLPS